ncbi:phosphoglucosamine mutase [Halorubellus sp. PRR65]|uniref:phosphoglucosamine mutase n=1 Tax=Halorubellus sp. PRR65 TaxID=3098148 RepID=UPI002B25FAF4|nr:phosphoglucosamine mutase [Halorubellus sp. PRR65]
MKVFGSSGTRGVANDELTPGFVLRVAKAAGTAWTAERVAIARDTRATGRMLADAAAAGLASVGVDVDRLGVVATPGAQAYAEHEHVPAVMITASHNPPEYNGVKLVGADGVELAVEDLERVEDVLVGETFADATWDEVGDETRVADARDRYVDELLASVDRERIADADLTVALDPGHGAGCLTSPTFFRQLGCKVVTVNAQPDGHFPGRDPEPVPKNLTDLGRLVRSTDADVGIAHDGDADRAIFYDERGEYVEGDATLAALAAAKLEPGDTTVSAVNVSQRLVDVAADADADLELTPIGSTNIITRIEELEADGEHVPVAGEGNGGVFFPDYRLSRDGAFVGARFLELVADRPVSEIVAPYDDYHNVRRNLDYDTEAERTAMLDAADAVAADADADLSTIDGYRLDYGDAWVLARPSGTEPLVRVYAEARSEERANELADFVVAELADARDAA